MDTHSVQKCKDYVPKYKLSYVQIIWGRRLVLVECLITFQELPSSAVYICTMSHHTS